MFRLTGWRGLTALLLLAVVSTVIHAGLPYGSLLRILFAFISLASIIGVLVGIPTLTLAALRRHKGRV